MSATMLLGTSLDTVTKGQDHPGLSALADDHEVKKKRCGNRTHERASLWLGPFERVVGATHQNELCLHHRVSGVLLFLLFPPLMVRSVAGTLSPSPYQRD